ncbi:MAG: prepilin-type N-terminal cleavage/methylation domain-containing protein [Candidatus Sulfotelmatobacter sp.]
MASSRQRGFSLLEMMIALSISIVLAAVAAVALQPTFRQQHVNDAYNGTISALRRAHDAAAADMRIYEVAFTQPGFPASGTITVTQVGTGSPVLFTTTIPNDVTFHVEPGVPTSSTTSPFTPDGFGSASNAFDFDQPPSGTGGSNVIYFYPDGSAQDAAGNVNNGVVYMGIPGQLPTARAVTVWGYTGRIRGYHLTKVANVWTWSQQ